MLRIKLDHESILNDIFQRALGYTRLTLKVEAAAALIILIWFQITVFGNNAVFLSASAISVCALVFAWLPPNRLAKMVSSPEQGSNFLLFLAAIETFIIMLLLPIIAAPIVLIPMQLASTFYNYRKSLSSMLAACICVGIAPGISYLLGFWDPGMLLNFMQQLFGQLIHPDFIVKPSPLNNLMAVFLFISLPWLIITYFAGRLALLAAKDSEFSVHSQAESQRLSRMDHLTGLYNQNVYNRLLKTRLNDMPVGVLFFDVDGLKRVNDKHGHEMGDELLRHGSRSLHSILSDQTIGFRVGGDEFLVLVNTSDEAELSRMVAKWKAELERINEEAQDELIGVHCAMSVGTAFGSQLNLKELIDLADQRMYCDKASHTECSYVFEKNITVNEITAAAG